MDAGSAAWLDALQASGIRPGLSRMRTFLRALGHPERLYPSIIVAGTNGKGSTSATLASILNTSGYRTGLYTSPHLVRLQERWTIGGTEIDDESLARSIEKLRSAAGDVGFTPTYFEALTLIAFIAFADAKCEIAVLEVGMGGRLDATNVVRPIASLLTPVGFDHTEFLGNTIRKIAAEKAGVIHRGAIVLTSNDDPIILDVIRKRAAKFGSPFHHVAETHSTPLAGAFQERNAALAVRAAEELRAVLPRITTASIERGVAATRWRGRLEKVDRGGKEVWIDGGHNAHAVRAILPFIAERIPAPRLLVFGIMSDKDVGDVTALLFPLFESIIATEPYPPRSVAAGDLVAIAQRMSIDAAAEPDPSRAIARALASGYRSIVVAGSLYLAGAAIGFFDAHGKEQGGDQKR
ncbi:MAG TPA: folylpolyglutamate synthase/dihydrofolate synthase family protein [Thermoanaerobaculia bacterium]|nr:folylpolyglutamate synthase/dihydrofolate synthase family protein [Thermoanaerobaculia bacterium]